MTGRGAIDLVVTDLDGTVWDGERQTHPTTVSAWRELERRDIPVLVATGRRLGSTVSSLAELGLAPPVVCLNGALGVDLADGSRFHRATIAAPDAVTILAAFRASGLQPCVYVDHHEAAVFVDVAPSTHPDHLASFGVDVATADLELVCRDASVLAFAVLGVDEAPLAAVAEAIGGAGIPHLSPDPFFGGHALTVAGPAMSKWEGVRSFCALRAIDPTRVLAIGDGPNDVELLTGAAIALVPADGHPTAMALADRVVAATSLGGWSEILDLV